MHEVRFDRPAVAARVSAHGSAERRWMGEVVSDFLATGQDTGGAFCLVDETAPQGESVPLHCHPEDVESIYVIEGELRIFLGDDPGTRVGSGGFAHFPGGTVHGFRVLSDRARYLLLTTPRHGEFYRAITLPSGPDGSKPEGSVGRAVIEAACREYGITWIGDLPPEVRAEDA